MVIVSPQTMVEDILQKRAISTLSVIISDRSTDVLYGSFGRALPRT
jgi:hypothetical protein